MSNQQNNGRISLSQRLFRTSALLLLILGFGFAAIYALDTYRERVTMVGNFNHFVASTISSTIAMSLAEGDVRSVNEQLHTLDLYPIVRLACVYQNNQLVASYTATSGTCAAQPNQTLSDQLSAMQRVTYNDHLVGRVVVHSPRSALTSELPAQLVPFIVAMVALLLVMLVLTRAIANRTTSSLTQLTNSARRSEGADQHFDFSVDPSAPTEVAALANAFNELILDLVSARDDAKLEASHRQRAEQAERRVRQLLRNIIDLVPYVIYAQRSDGTLVFANQAAANFYGASGDELVSSNPQALKNHLPGVGGSASAYNVDLTITDHSGSERRFKVTRVPFDRGGTSLVIAVDVTEEHRLQTQLQFAQRLETVGTLAGGIAHDFNNLLTPILGYSSLLQEKPLDPTVAEYINHIQTAAEKARNVVQQILSFSRQQPIQTEQVAISDVISAAVELSRATIPATIEITVDAPFDLLVRGDGGQLEQVLMNLLTNASQAIAGKTGRIKVTAGLLDNPPPDAAVSSGPTVAIQVADSGPGIAQDIAQHVFEPFFTTKAIGEGSGLGLSVAHGIMRSHQGDLVVLDASPGHTTFAMLLPLYEPLVALPDTDPNPRGEAHVLVVDDEPEVLQVATDLIARLGYSARGVCDPLDALLAIEQPHHGVVAVITDQRMPGLTGNELAHRIKHIEPRMPIIAMSGYLQNGRLDPVFDGYLAKPLDRDELAARLARVISKPTESITAAN